MKVQDTSHTRLRARDHYTFQALSLVQKVELVQDHFTLRLRDQRIEYVDAQWMWSLRGFLHDIEWIMVHGYLDYFQKSFLGGRPNTKPLGDHGTLNAHDRWFIVFYRIWGAAWIEVRWKSIWLRVWSHITSHYMMLEGVLGRLLDTFLLGSQFHGHNSWLVCEVAFRAG